MGNVWRFPYLCYRNGGGTFLVPYLLALVFIGAPLFLLELALGQRFSLGATHAYGKLHRRFRGVGCAGTVMAYVCLMYYNVILAWTVVYGCHALRPGGVPWGDARVDSERFWERQVLHQSRGFEDFGKAGGPASAPLAVALVFSWACLFFATRRGVHSAGRVAYVAATAPYAILVLLVLEDIPMLVINSAILFNDVFAADCDNVFDNNTINFDDDGDGYAERDGDCDDSNPFVSPDSPEACNGVDDDCDGTIDETDGAGDANGGTEWGSSLERILDRLDSSSCECLTVIGLDDPLVQGAVAERPRELMAEAYRFAPLARLSPKARGRVLRQLCLVVDKQIFPGARIDEFSNNVFDYMRVDADVEERVLALQERKQAMAA